MAFLPFFSKKKPVDVEQQVTRQPDGSTTVRTSFNVPETTRPVNSDAVDALDSALGTLGTNVMHAMDPRRLISFDQGGPPVWSVGMVDVAGPTPYTLLVTYGFSHALSPESFREGITHEYSLAVPKGLPLSPWADAFLRHQTRYILAQGADIRVNDCIPLRGVPMTRVPFQPEHHAMMPNSELIGVLCAEDPVLPTVHTPHGAVIIRRLLGIDGLELDRAETWSPAGLIEAFKTVNPLLLSDIGRTSFMKNPAFAAAVNARAEDEGSSMDAALFDVAWSLDDAGRVRIELPVGQAAKRLLDGLRGRVGFGRRLAAISMRSPPILFEPSAAGVQPTRQGLVLGGDLSTGPAVGLVMALRGGDREVVLS